jgi:hypothetical protein
MAKTQDLKALRRMISEAHQILQTSPELPQGRTPRALELLGDSVALADYLLTIEPAALAALAVILYFHRFGDVEPDLSKSSSRSHQYHQPR